MLSLHKPEGTGRVGKPAIRWLNSFEEKMFGSDWTLEIGDEYHRIRTNGYQSQKGQSVIMNCSDSER
jgi:hypothetical protein